MRQAMQFFSLLLHVWLAQFKALPLSFILDSRFFPATFHPQASEQRGNRDVAFEKPFAELTVAEKGEPGILFGLCLATRFEPLAVLRSHESLLTLHAWDSCGR